MQQLKIVHEKSTNNNNSKQIVSKPKKQQELEYENKREGHGLNIALTRKVLRLENSDTFYVESESSDNLYYFVRFNHDVFEWCSCPDNSIRGSKCKHQYAIEYAIKKGTLKDIDKLPAEAKRYNDAECVSAAVEAKSYRDYKEDQYDF